MQLKSLYIEWQFTKYKEVVFLTKPVMSRRNCRRALLILNQCLAVLKSSPHLLFDCRFISWMFQKGYCFMTLLTKQLLICAENLPLSLWTILVGCAGGRSPGLSCSVALNSLYPPGQVPGSTLGHRSVPVILKTLNCRVSSDHITTP